MVQSTIDLGNLISSEEVYLKNISNALALIKNDHPKSEIFCKQFNQLIVKNPPLKPEKFFLLFQVFFTSLPRNCTLTQTKSKGSKWNKSLMTFFKWQEKT